jgi:hypothetical protein
MPLVVADRKLFGTIWLADRVLVQVAIKWWIVLLPAPVATMRTLSLNIGLSPRLGAMPVVGRADIARNGRKEKRNLRKEASEEVAGEAEAGVEGEVPLPAKTIVLELGPITGVEEAVAAVAGLRNHREKIPTLGMLAEQKCPSRVPGIHQFGYATKHALSTKTSHALRRLCS